MLLRCRSVLSRASRSCPSTCLHARLDQIIEVDNAKIGLHHNVISYKFNNWDSFFTFWILPRASPSPVPAIPPPSRRTRWIRSLNKVTCDKTYFYRVTIHFQIIKNEYQIWDHLPGSLKTSGSSPASVENPRSRQDRLTTLQHKSKMTNRERILMFIFISFVDDWQLGIYSPENRLSAASRRWNLPNGYATTRIECLNTERSLTLKYRAL